MSLKDKQHILCTEYAADVDNIRARIDSSDEHEIFVGPGWYGILAATNYALNVIDPDYKVTQVKEKLGGLRYYYSPSTGVSKHDQLQMREIVEDAERVAWQTCEECGDSGRLHKNSWNVKTLCEECLSRQSEHPEKEVH